MPKPKRLPYYHPSNNLISKAHEVRGHKNPPTVESTYAFLPTSTPPTPYQIACHNRVKELTDFCADEYNIEPIHVRLIVSALLPSNYLPVWMIYETKRTPFWNHINFAIKQLGIPPITNLSGMRLLHAKTADKWYMEWMSVRHEQPRIFIDTHHSNDQGWRRRMHSAHAYWQATAECAKATIPAVMLKLPRLGAEEEMARLIRLVIDPHNRQVLPEPITPSIPLNEIIHALPRLNRELADSESLFSAITMLPGGHAALFGRPISHLIDADYYCMMQAVRGSIRQNVRALLYWFFHSDSKHQDWIKVADIVEKLGLPRRTTFDFLTELTGMGILDKRTFKHKNYYMLTDLGMLGASVVGVGPDARWW